MPPIHHHKRAESVVAGDCERVFFLYRLLDIIILLLFDGLSPYIIPLASSTVKVIRNQWIKNG